MKNLKRALSLALSAFMLVGMMAVGASAAEFSDAEDIKHTDAVNTMVALGIIKGNDDGSFDPDRIVNRAEMAKMICVALNGGTDPNLSGGGLYPDTKGHWASGYIDYCTNTGIVAGDNHGNFNPDKAVTTVEASKMILIAMGYNAQTEKFVNDANWAINIGVVASTRGLYKGVPALADAPLSRDNAAQMIFNGIQADMVKYELVGIINGTGVSQAVEIKDKTILSDKFETYGKAPEGVMAEFTYDSVKENWKYTVVVETGDGAAEMTFKTDKDFTDLFGMNVRVIAQAGGDEVVYGIFAQDSSVLAEGYWDDLGDVENGKVKLAGTSYKVERGFGAAEFATGDPFTTESATASVKLIDNDGNGKADVAIVTPFTLAKVTYMGKDSLTMDNGVKTKKFDDITMDENIAKGDYVCFTEAKYTAKDMDNVALAEVSTGTVTASKTGKWMINGEWMTNSSDTTLNVNDVIDYIAFGTHVYYAKVTDGDSYTTDIAFVYNATAKTGNNWESAGDAKAALLFTDGTKKSVVTDEDYTALVGKMVTYKVNNDDEYVLTAVDGDNMAGYDSYGATAPSGRSTIEKVGGYELADDAVVFVAEYKGSVDGANAGNKAKVISGKEAKDLAVGNYNAGAALASKDGGFSYAKVAVITPKNTSIKLPDTFTGNTYGYLTADSYRTVEGGKNYLNFTIWTADGEVVAKAKTDDAAADFKAGTLVTFDTVDNATVKNVESVTATTSAVTGYDGDKKIQIVGTGVTKMTDDTTILFIDSEDTAGFEGGSIELAQELEDGTYVDNVSYILNGAGTEYVLIVVDVNNEMKA